jgi:hypothetical protein
LFMDLIEAPEAERLRDAGLDLVGAARRLA